MVSKRIEAIASLVPKGSVILDVGTDHAYLPIYLIQNNIVSRALASDVSAGAIKMAINNIRLNNLEGVISTYLSDGLKNVPKCYDTISISGMGTKTIKNILSGNLNLDTYIIQSNNELYELRKFFNVNGYIIDKEIIVYENEIYYSVIHFKKGIEVLDEEILRFGKSNDSIYFNHLKKKYLDLIKKVPEEKVEEFNDYINMLNKLLEENRI